MGDVSQVAGADRSVELQHAAGNGEKALILPVIPVDGQGSGGAGDGSLIEEAGVRESDLGSECGRGGVCADGDATSDCQ